MVMGKRADVPTASAPVAAVDTVVLAQQLAAALVRVPFRDPFRGHSNPAANVVTAVTREVLRTFMGYSSSLPIDEFRSIEVMLDDLCRVVMRPVVAAHDGRAASHRARRCARHPLHAQATARPRA